MKNLEVQMIICLFELLKKKIGDLIVRVGIKLNKTGSFLVKKYKNVDEELNV